MIRSYRYRLYPSRAQEATLFTWLNLTRELYNAALQERKDAWQKQRIRVTAFDQMRALPDVRKIRPEFSGVSIIVLRSVIQRLDTAFAGFFRRCKSKAKPGYPRFHGHNRFNSILINDLGNCNPIVAGGKRVKVPMLGKIKFKQHRSIEGTPKAMRLTLRAGRWYVSLACEGVKPKPLPATGREVGIDLGLTYFIATSDGDTVNVPRAEKENRLVLARAQRRVSRRKRGSNRRRKAVRLLARTYEHVASVRRERHIVLAKGLVAAYDKIYVEKLNIKSLTSGMLAGPVHDAGWASFLHWLRVKAEEAGREVIEVNPAGTSQTCSSCGCEVRKDLSVRVHDCPHCGYKSDRDVNAARNILGLGRSLRREALAVSRPRRPEKSQIEPTESPSVGLT